MPNPSLREVVVEFEAAVAELRSANQAATLEIEAAWPGAVVQPQTRSRVAAALESMHRANESIRAWLDQENAQ